MYQQRSLEIFGPSDVSFGQGFKYMLLLIKELMDLTLKQKIVYGGYPVLRWMMDNIYICTDSDGNIKTDKEKSLADKR